MHKVAAFAGLEVLTWAALDNHFDLLLHLSERPELTEEDVFCCGDIASRDRLGGLLGGRRSLLP